MAQTSIPVPTKKEMPGKNEPLHILAILSLTMCRHNLENYKLATMQA